MLAGSASMRADIDATDRYCARTLGADPEDPVLKGFCLGCQGVALLLRGETEAALGPYRRGMAILAKLPNAEPFSLRALWTLLLASLGDRRAAGAIDEALGSP